MRNSSRDVFIKELDKGNARLNLARAALIMAAYLGESFEVADYVAQLDALAQPLQAAAARATTDPARLHMLNAYLFEQHGFGGNANDYYRPENSFLNRVLDDRVGIPITLSVIYLEVGWRLHLPVWGIAMPHHFIVGFGSTALPTYIDVFNRGRILSLADCLEIVNVDPINADTFRRRFLKPVTPKEILYRILLNLKHIYFNHKDWSQAYKTVDMLTLINPNRPTELKDLGLLALQQNRLQDALFYLKRFLFLSAKTQDTAWIEERVDLIEERLLTLN